MGTAAYCDGLGLGPALRGTLSMPEPWSYTSGAPLGTAPLGTDPTEPCTSARVFASGLLPAPVSGPRLPLAILSRDRVVAERDSRGGVTYLGLDLLVDSYPLSPYA